MANIDKDCIDEALRGLIHFSKDDLQDYARDVFVKAKSYDNLQNAQAFDKAIKEINDAHTQSYWEDSNMKANDLYRYRRNENFLKSAGQTFRDLILPRNRPGAKLTENLTAYQQAEYETMVDHILGDLTHDETTQLTDGKLDNIICDVHDGKKSDDPFINKIAQKIKDFMVYRNGELVISDAMKFSEINEDRAFRAIHDQSKVMTAGESLAKIAGDKTNKKHSMADNMGKWRDYIKTKLDLVETFSKTKAMQLDGALDDAEVDRILERIYDNITTGKSDIFTRSIVSNDAEATANRSRMFFKWKGLKDQYDYNKVFGRGNLFSMWMRDASASANKIGLTKQFGTNPESMYNDLRKIQQDSNPKGALWWRNTDNYYKAASQQDKLSIAPKLTNFIANTKMVVSMARLATLGLDSISDIGYQASFAQRMGIDYYKAYTNGISHIFDTMDTPNRIRIAKLMRTQVDNHLGYIGRWADENNVSSLVNKVSTQFFKANLLERFDRGAKKGNMALMGEELANNSGKKLSELNPYMNQYVSKFLDEHEWDLLRKKNKQGMFTTDNVDALTDSEIKDFHAKTGNGKPLSWTRDDLYRKVHAMYTINAENTVLTPTNFERAWLGQGLQKGSTPEALLSLMTQFKYYPIAYIDRVLVGGWKDADTKSRKLLWASSMLAGTIPLSMLSMYLKNVVMNKTMPHWSEMNVPEREQHLISMIAPSLGIFSNFVSNKGGTPGMEALKLLGSPSTTMIGYGLSSVKDVAHGDIKAAAKKMGHALTYVAPINTIPVISPLIEHAMGTKAYMEPGQRKLFGS